MHVPPSWFKVPAMADVEAPLERTSAAELELLAALRAGDEDAFVRLVERYQGAMVRVAMMYVPSRAVAEEVVQETWLAVLQGLERFEGRSSLKTWIFRILMNRAMTRGQREHRTVPFSALFDPTTELGEPAVDPDRFANPNAPRHWSHPPKRWDLPEERLLGKESLDHVAAAIETLTPSQREVITLRDVDGWSSKEVCNVLGITETNQRVLLHRARSKVRRALEQYFDEPS
jgi:RNA polymerase sigma-70 factor (ECF subfamily)